MTKTLYRIRLPEINSGMFACPHTSTVFSVDPNGVLQSVIEEMPLTPAMRSRRDTPTMDTEARIQTLKWRTR